MTPPTTARGGERRLVSYASPVLTWTGDLAVGATATVTFSVTVNNPDTGDKLLIMVASSSAAGSSCPPGTTGAPCPRSPSCSC